MTRRLFPDQVETVDWQGIASKSKVRARVRSRS